MPYKSIAPAVTDVVAGRFRRLPRSCDRYRPDTCRRLRLLAVAAKARSTAFPRRRRLQKRASRRGRANWFGIRVRRSYLAALSTTQRRDNKAVPRLKCSKASPPQHRNLAQLTRRFATMLQSETVRWGKVVKRRESARVATRMLRRRSSHRRMLRDPLCCLFVCFRHAEIKASLKACRRSHRQRQAARLKPTGTESAGLPSR